MEEFIAEFVKEVLAGEKNIHSLKMRLCKKHRIARVPSNIEIYVQLPELPDVNAHRVQQVLLTKPVRSLSGVAVIAVMDKPGPCPHGRCLYCPGGIGSPYGDTPQSYTGKEPSALRALRHEYNSYRIVFNRLEQYIVGGHVPEKVDVIIQGGTFPATSYEHQDEVVSGIFQSLNDFSREFFPHGEFSWERFRTFFELPGHREDKAREARINERVIHLQAAHTNTLKHLQAENERAKIRCIGLTIETKPDWGTWSHGNEMLELGATRVELGIQTVYDEVLERVHRGHDIETSVHSIRELKDLGFKLNFHMMPGLPGVTKEEDIAALRTIFTDPNYMPDMLKIYPTMVMPGTGLWTAWKKGEYTPLSTEKAAEIIAEAKRDVPEWCRIMRVQRDIPTKYTGAGVDKTNLRQYVEQKCKEKGIECRCIRCREIKDEVAETWNIRVSEYTASHGREFFIQAEHNDRLLGFVRMRFPSQILRPEITKHSALIRELHVYGRTLALGERHTDSIQHRGIGKELMRRAEEIAKRHGKDKMLVISGVGVREYFRKIGYELEEVYMVKKLTHSTSRTDDSPSTVSVRS